MLCCFSRVQLFTILWTEAHRAPLSVGFSWQEYWRGLPCPSLGDFSDLGMEPWSHWSPALAGGFFITSAAWEAPHEWRGNHSLLQGIFLTQGLNLGLLHRRWILYRKGHQGS